jgi:hypothetical protein
MRKRIVAAALLVFLRAHAGTSAQQGNSGTMPTNPWRWDLEARLRLRFDDASRLERLNVTGIHPDAGSSRNLVDGSKNPELLLPWELYQFLMSTAFYGDPDVASAWRSRYARVVPRLKIDEQFWIRLEKASTPYLATERELKALGDRVKASGPRDMNQVLLRAATIERNLCHQRMIALNNANSTFGSDWFGEFLYLAVAPNIKVSSDSPMSPEQHRRVSGGCQ